MRKYGFIKHSLVDYPGEVCSVLFLPGCNFRCPYCHNWDLTRTVETGGVSLDEIVDYLQEAGHRFITAVCISGGEPTLYPEHLLELIDLFKKLHLKVKVDTNGSHPEQMQTWLHQVDYVAMDLKTSLERYSELVEAPLKKDIQTCVECSMSLLLKEPKNRYEFRTTLSWDFVDESVMHALGHSFGGEKPFWYLQKCRPLSGRLSQEAVVTDHKQALQCMTIAKQYTPHVFLRE